MYQEHPEFNPPNRDQKVWRYMDFTKFVELLNSSSLYFSRVKHFEDTFEGTLSEVTLRRIKEEDPYFEVTREVRNTVFENTAVNCWHMNDDESVAMWNLYLKSKEGIAIQTTFSRLAHSFNNTGMPIMAGCINYADYGSVVIPHMNLLAAFTYKRRSYEHERELRCLALLMTEKEVENAVIDEYGVRIRVDLTELIENIYVCPGSQPWIKKLVEDVIKKYGYSFNVERSPLDSKPLR